jgi:hypothetical protein
MRFKNILTILLALSFFSGLYAQTGVSISGIIKAGKSKSVLPFVNVFLKTEKDSSFVSGTITDEDGRFKLTKIKSDKYYLEVSFIGYITKKQSLFVGNLTEYLDLKIIELTELQGSLKEIIISGTTEGVSEKMDKKIFSLKDNISQSGGSVLQGLAKSHLLTLHLVSCTHCFRFVRALTYF